MLPKMENERGSDNSLRV